MTKRTATNRTATKRQAQKKRQAAVGVAARRGAARRRRSWWFAGVAAVAVVVVFGGLYGIFRSTSPAPGEGDATAGSAEYPFAVGQPGPGERAPDFALPSTAGGQQSLSAYRGKTVLLYFQEGLMCQPCWDQISDLERNGDAVRAAGIDQTVSITTDPVDLLTQRTQDMKLATPTLSDPDLTVSRTYTTNRYGMMGEDRNGHTFILVSPDGVIRWRADYGGAPKYTMFVPTDRLLADLKAGATQ